ncbi:Sucrase/ferredoxin-like-domain-containing protein [Cokeromyces recurvatus]|uniref:Sucrase/ferredoxin-like-domain-containing protein n=1 Tax=Cokeromyces recurvatus TaxID=90255 RepID=UPI00221FA58C|nr:Sucrase/ferredoxin-like-domain-containing protein [Cokeromyces recurvatus]KAI7907842.1 Sucrase/ferredoxin-like-domain-containing protein [Cokeromyces recurvatus]
MLLCKTLAVRIPPVTRFYHSVPFDPKPFPFSRFEPCCPSNEAAAPNGYVPCRNHPIPDVLGKKIDMSEDMTRPSSTLRHLVACVGPDALEWTRSKVEAVPGGILHTIQNTENQWLRAHTPTKQEKEEGRLVLTTVTEKPSHSPNQTDILLFPEFKIITTTTTQKDTLESNSNLYQVLSSIWQNPHNPLSSVDWQDMEADTVVLVCTHARRDLRCGKIGPLIIEEFNRVIKEKGLQGKVEVWGTSHFGGITMEYIHVYIFIFYLHLFPSSV